ncbi:uncharacterized protein LOC111615074 [Centruroides sculpturatus]|uniref:uncharacterized protein LOC111615074 n=1 Tax=Centruroides sculpturatus TaxID=218467 RepID=UPI000C6DD227|nr:uncharacterized protein LOC111615074 [Centruroides sculpturatus]
MDEELKKTIDIKEIKVGVKDMRQIRNGVILRCSSKEGAERLKSEINNSNKFEAKAPRKLNPRITINKIPFSWKNTYVKKNLMIYNTELQDDNFRPLFPINKDEHTELCAWVMELMPSCRRKLKDNGDIISIGWNSSKIRDFYNFKRCNKCFHYGHLGKECNAGIHCPDCSKAGHNARECECELHELQCINCEKYNKSCRREQDKVNTNHRARNRKCPDFKYQCEVAKARVCEY